MRPLTVDRNDRLRGSKAKSRKQRKLPFFGKGREKPKEKPPAGAKSEPRFGGLSSLPSLPEVSLQFTNMLGFKPQKKQKKQKTTARKKPAPSWRKPAVICSSVLLVAIAVAGISNFLSQQQISEQLSGWIDEQQQAMASAFGLTVQNISVVGRNRTDPKNILRALDVQRGDSILSVDPAEARERLETLGWVQTASIMRRYPDELFIVIQERRPFARWQIDGQTGVIDRSGALVAKKAAAEFSHLPKVVGEGANIHAAELFDMLAQTPTLFTRVKNAIRIRDRRWNLEFDNKVTVLLPEDGATQAWMKLHAMQQEKKILNNDLMAIDLRSGDRMYVRLKPEAAALRRADGKET
jgi:cell division protein FtsQ